MKKLIPIFLILLLAVSCKDKCKDEFCPSGYVCMDGVCKSSDGCPIGYEGDDCDTESNQKFAGSYDTDYSGSGGLMGSDGNTTADVTLVPGSPNKIRVDVELDLAANVIGQAIDLPLVVSVVGDVDGDTYSVPSTTIEASVDIAGFPITIDLTFNVLGTKISEDQLNTTLTMTGTIAGTVDMVGTK